MKNRLSAICMATLLALSGPVSAQVSSGGDFRLEQAVIAGGGGTSTDSTATIFRLDGTIGQNTAGTQMTGGDFSQVGGFWAFRPLSPTAASVPISGRVAMRNGRGISGAVVVLTDLNGATRMVVTNTFGNFRFDGIAVGQTIVLSVEHRRYAFETAVLAFDISDAVDDINFVAQ